jgi:hypothetical protein
LVDFKLSDLETVKFSYDYHSGIIAKLRIINNFFFVKNYYNPSNFFKILFIPVFTYIIVGNQIYSFDFTKLIQDRVLMTMTIVIIMIISAILTNIKNGFVQSEKKTINLLLTIIGYDEVDKQLSRNDVLLIIESNSKEIFSSLRNYINEKVSFGGRKMTFSMIIIRLFYYPLILLYFNTGEPLVVMFSLFYFIYFEMFVRGFLLVFGTKIFNS